MAPVGPPPCRLLERDDEVSALAALVSSGSGTGFVEGAAGVGKTALLAQATSCLREEVLLLRGRGSAFEAALAFGVVRQLLERWVGSLGDERRAALLQGAAVLAAEVLDGGARPPDPGDDHSLAVTHALGQVLFRIADGRRVVLAVDDVQWADEASQRFLAHVAARLEERDVVLLVACRTGVAAGPATAQLRDLASVVVRPAPLTPQAVHHLVEGALGEGWGDVARWCHRATHGNPLYLQHLVRRLAAERLDPAALSEQDVLRLGAVDLVSDVDARLSAAGAEVRAVASALAALGDGASPSAVAEVARLAPPAVATAHRLLQQLDLVTPGEPMSFTHPLLREAVEQVLPPGWRRRAAQHLAERSRDVEAAAARAARERPAADPWVVALLREGARRAVARGAPGVAAGLLGRALREPPDADQLADVLYEAGELASWVGSPEGPDLLRRAWAAATTPRVRAQRGLALARALASRDQHLDAVEVLEASATALGPADADLRAALQTQVVVIGMQDARLVLRALPAVAGLAERPEDPVAREVVGLVEANAIGMGGGTEQQVRQRLLAAAPTADGSAVGWDVRSFTAFSLLSTSGYEEAHRMLAEAADEGTRRGAVRARLLATSGWQTSAWLRGDLPRAVREGRETLELCLAMRAPDAVVVASAVLALSHLDAGEVLEAAAVLESSPDPAHHPNLMTCLAYAARSRLLLAQGAADRAVAEIRRGDERFRALLPMTVPSPAMWSWRSPLVEALLASGDAAAAREEAASELLQARTWGGSRPLGIALRDAAAAGVEQAGTGAVALLTEAVAVLRPTPHRLELARALAALWRRDRDARSRDEAVQLATRCGARPLVAELTASTVEPAPTLAALLTPAERRVAELAAQGMTNAEVAQALHLSVATVKSHLLRMFDKLGIRNRTQLARLWEGPVA